MMKPTGPLDTSPGMGRIRIECLCRKSAAARLQLALKLTRTSRRLLAMGVRRRYPEHDDEQVRLAVIRLTLPKELFLAAYPRAKDLRP